jgi:DNA-binding response OmpR family regulator
MSQVSGDHASLPVPRILIADPDAAARAAYRDSLEPDAYDVVEAEDGRDALARALVRPPALVMTELRLPIIDGLALCEILRYDTATSRVPILVVTGETDPVAFLRARRAGVDTIISKPTEIATVLHEIRRLLARSRVLRQRSQMLRARADDQQGKSEELRHRADRLVLSKALHRYQTTEPPTAPPHLRCPSCDGELTYLLSHVGGVNERNLEQWDDFTCAACGRFQYRHRTRVLRAMQRHAG